MNTAATELARGRSDIYLSFSRPVWVNVIALMSFFPFFAFLPGLDAEVQPYCYLLVFAFIFIFRQRLPGAYYWFLLIVAAYFLYFLVREFLYQPDLSSIVYILIYIGPPLFFYVIYANFKFIQLKYIHTAFYIWIGVALMQQYFSAFFSVTGLVYPLRYLLPRFRSDALTEIDRGVSSLSNEPSHAGIIFFGLFVVVVYRFLRKDISLNRFLLDCLLFLMAIVTNSSVTMFLSLLTVLVAFVYQTKSYFKVLIGIVLLIIPFLFIDIDFRIFSIIKILPDLLDTADWSLYNLVVGPFFGSNREFSSSVGIVSGIYHPFGNGYHSSLTEFVRVAKGVGFDLSKISFYDSFNSGIYLNMKPYGYGSFILFEIGIIPFLLINIVFVKLMLKACKTAGRYKRFGVLLGIFLLLFINFSSLASLPTYWFAYIVTLHIINLRSDTKIIK